MENEGERKKQKVRVIRAHTTDGTDDVRKERIMDIGRERSSADDLTLYIKLAIFFFLSS